MCFCGLFVSPIDQAGGKKRQFEKKMAAQKGTGAENYTCLSLKYKASFIKAKTHSTVISPAVWFGMPISLSFPTRFPFSLCVARCALSIMASATKHRCRGGKKNDETWKFAESFA